MIITYIVCKNKQESEKISKHLLDKKLVGCVNMFPITSQFWWKGNIEKEEEHVIIAKTFENKFKEITKEVKKLHSYETPAILKFNVEAEKEYEEWLRREVK